MFLSLPEALESGQVSINLYRNEKTWRLGVHEPTARGTRELAKLTKSSQATTLPRYRDPHSPHYSTPAKFASVVEQSKSFHPQQHLN